MFTVFHRRHNTEPQPNVIIDRACSNAAFRACWTCKALTRHTPSPAAACIRGSVESKKFRIRFSLHQLWRWLVDPPRLIRCAALVRRSGVTRAKHTVVTIQRSHHCNCSKCTSTTHNCFCIPAGRRKCAGRIKPQTKPGAVTPDAVDSMGLHPLLVGALERPITRDLSRHHTGPATPHRP